MCVPATRIGTVYTRVSNGNVTVSGEIEARTVAAYCRRDPRLARAVVVGYFYAQGRFSEPAERIDVEPGAGLGVVTAGTVVTARKTPGPAAWPDTNSARLARGVKPPDEWSLTTALVSGRPTVRTRAVVGRRFDRL